MPKYTCKSPTNCESNRTIEEERIRRMGGVWAAVKSGVVCVFYLAISDQLSLFSFIVSSLLLDRYRPSRRATRIEFHAIRVVGFTWILNAHKPRPLDLLSYKTADFLLSTYRLISINTLQIQILSYLNRAAPYFTFDKVAYTIWIKNNPIVNVVFS